MDEYRQFLAEQILAEDKVVTYRYLSRSMKVHANIAKQMLYDFHKSQNAKKPGSVHATYLLYGTSRSEPGQKDEGDGDVEMTSSMPEGETLSEQVPTLTLSLVPEEQLNDALQHYEHVSSIHVYSVGPHPISDLQMIAETYYQDIQSIAEDATPEARNAYGAITNAHAHRRQRGEGAPIPAVAQPAVKPDVKPAPSKPAATAPKTETLKEAKPSTKDAPSTAPVKKPTPSLKRGGSSGIMQAFAKGASAAKPKKETPQAATPSGAEDESSMALSDDGEDDSEVVPPRNTASEDDSGRRSRKEREEALRRMMDDDEDEDEEPEEKADTPMEEAEEPAEEAPVPAPTKEEASEVVSASTGDGRRRGKRRVMRKKQILDDQGYLVTIQEPGWESFSEDEPTSSSRSSQPTSTAPASQASSKAKKAGPKGSQGSIMSFFAKK